MKHLCGCFKSQSFSWSAIQSVLNRSNILTSDRGHGSFLWNVLARQTVEVFIASPFPSLQMVWQSKQCFEVDHQDRHALQTLCRRQKVSKSSKSETTQSEFEMLQRGFVSKPFRFSKNDFPFFI